MAIGSFGNFPEYAVHLFKPGLLFLFSLGLVQRAPSCKFGVLFIRELA